MGSLNINTNLQFVEMFEDKPYLLLSRIQFSYNSIKITASFLLFSSNFSTDILLLNTDCD